jgi:hypothetical protein
MKVKEKISCPMLFFLTDTSHGVEALENFCYACISWFVDFWRNMGRRKRAASRLQPMLMIF